MKLILLMFISVIVLGASEYVDDDACKKCHSQEHSQWQGSHHDLAMKTADDQSVVGDFNNASFSLHGVTSTFYNKDKKYFIRTDGEDGKLHDYEVTYTFGVYPLQQYLLKFPDGKFQVPDIACDSRSKKEGG